MWENISVAGDCSIHLLVCPRQKTACSVTPLSIRSSKSVSSTVALSPFRLSASMSSVILNVTWPPEFRPSAADLHRWWLNCYGKFRLIFGWISWCCLVSAYLRSSRSRFVERTIKNENSVLLKWGFGTSIYTRGGWVNRHLDIAVIDARPTPQVRTWRLVVRLQRGNLSGSLALPAGVGAVLATYSIAFK